ncbi:hypothetical protein CapIbe_003061 [Capra ibex]
MGCRVGGWDPLAKDGVPSSPSGKPSPFLPSLPPVSEIREAPTGRVDPWGLQSLWPTLRPSRTSISAREPGPGTASLPQQHPLGALPSPSCAPISRGSEPTDPQREALQSRDLTLRSLHPLDILTPSFSILCLTVS